jgi:RNA polymerase sigma-70 factor, ECF subfamily
LCLSQSGGQCKAQSDYWSRSASGCAAVLVLPVSGRLGRSYAGALQSGLERQLEADLARALIAGQPEAFDRFVTHFRAKIFHYGWMMCGQPDDAEEVAQETLLKVFESLGQLREPDRVRAWVFRIAKNACLMQRRKSMFAPKQEESLDELRVGSEIAGDAPLPDIELERSELRALLDRVIRELPPAYRSVVMLRDREELSTEETAHILELSEDVVKTRLRRARVAMREKLDCYLNNHCFDVEPVASPAAMSAEAWQDLRGAWRHGAGAERLRST